MAERGDSPDNPVTCHLPVGERAYLTELRCPSGTSYRFRRQGSVGGSCPEPETHEGPHTDPSQPGSVPVDHYELTCSCGEEHTRDVYLDMYHPAAKGGSAIGGKIPAPVGQSELAPAAALPSSAPGDEEARSEELKSVLTRHLRPGERFWVERDDEGDVEVTSAERSVLARSHPRFYGYLMASSQRISNAAGCGIFVFYTSLAAGLCFAIKSQAFHGFADGDPSLVDLLDRLRTWWVYFPILCTSLWLYWKHDYVCEKRQYNEERNELAEHLIREGLDSYEIMPKLEGDDAVSTILKWMKTDRTLASISR